LKTHNLALSLAQEERQQNESSESHDNVCMQANYDVSKSSLSLAHVTRSFDTCRFKRGSARTLCHNISLLLFLICSTMINRDLLAAAIVTLRHSNPYCGGNWPFIRSSNSSSSFVSGTVVWLYKPCAILNRKEKKDREKFPLQSESS
jgi:hypothetical protein